MPPLNLLPTPPNLLNPPPSLMPLPPWLLPPCCSKALRHLSLAVDGSGVPGMDRVDSLADYLVDLRNQPSLVLTNQQVSNIFALWQNLLDYDKQRVVFAARHQAKLDTGRFRSPKKKQEFTPGVESLKRHALTISAPLAQWPDCCCLVETIFVRLCAIHRKTKKKGTGTVSRWDLILADYRKIRRSILANAIVMKQTNLQLLDVSHTTLVQWHNKKVKQQDTAVVMQGLQLPSRLSVAADPLLPANVSPPSPPPQPGPAHQYHLPSSTVGQAKLKIKRTILSDPPALPPAQMQQAQRQLIPAPPPGTQLVMLMPVASQGSLLASAPPAFGFGLSSAPPAIPSTPGTAVAPVCNLTCKVQHNTC
ncbi:uncharacterized protein LOC130222700 [Danio aesculapii]|uniref:uncharacterized protein LOC130222700 n=1 Tax=Danio aesculapii TaxID=1142201 RepID=UPI0024BF4E7E|nr:uncharacterized protein LOC130222700 [Danio aesculapii]